MEELALFWEIGLIIVAATFFAYLARIFRQPVILAYVFTGVLLGPLGFGLIEDQVTIRTLSEFGIAFLLFIVGLELDLKRLRDVGGVSTVVGIIKTAIVFGLGFMMALSLGYLRTEAIYAGLILSFSSTMVVIKLLSDKNELDTLHGRITLGILLIEDVIAIMVLSVISVQTGVNLSVFAISILKGMGLLSIALIMSKYILPPVLHFVARKQELLFLTALSLCFIYSWASHISGFSVAIGAFIAGISVATFPYNIEIVSRVRSLRDFFSTIFFVSLGLELLVTDTSALVQALFFFLPLIVIIKPAIIMALTSTYGYGRRTSFLTSISLIQISEFSLIIASAALSMHHIGQELFSVILFVALFSITLTSYTINYDNKLYGRLSSSLVFFEKLCRTKTCQLDSIPATLKKHVVVCGSHRMGYPIIKTLQKLGEDFVVVDFNPEIIQFLINEGIPCIYGDIGDMTIVERINLYDADVVVSTVPNLEDNILLIRQTKERNPKAAVFVVAETLDDALQLYNIGADYVIIPRFLAGETASNFIRIHARSPKDLGSERVEHIRKLQKMKEEELLDKYEPSFLRSLEEKINHKHRKNIQPND